MASKELELVVFDDLISSLKGVRAELANTITDDDFCCLVIAAAAEVVEECSRDLITIVPVTKVEQIRMLRDVLNKNGEAK